MADTPKSADSPTNLSRDEYERAVRWWMAQQRMLAKLRVLEKRHGLDSMLLDRVEDAMCRASMPTGDLEDAEDYLDYLEPIADFMKALEEAKKENER